MEIDSLVNFEFKKLQEILKISSIDANIRKINPQYLKKSIPFQYLLEFTFTFIFNNEEPAVAKVRFLTKDEYLGSYSAHYKEFSLKGVSFPVKQLLVFQAKSHTIYKDNFKLLDDFSNQVLGNMIFDELYNYFKTTNKFKILNAFYNSK